VPQHTPVAPHLQHVDQDHGVGHVSVQLLLLGHEGQIDERPGHDAGPAVEEELEVEPLANARVELDAHHVVVEDVPRELAAESHNKGGAYAEHPTTLGF